MMRRKTAAEYLDMTEAAFVREVQAARMPASVMLGGREHWYRAALDRQLELIAGSPETDDYRKRLQERYGQQAA
jgi:hypothetical protein